MEILTRKIKQTKKMDKSPPKSIETKSYKLNVRFIYLKIAAEKKNVGPAPLPMPRVRDLYFHVQWPRLYLSDLL